MKRYLPRPRGVADYIMETFLIVKRKDVPQHGECRTKRVIPEVYDAMQRAIAIGEPYRTRLDSAPPTHGWRMRAKRD